MSHSSDAMGDADAADSQGIESADLQRRMFMYTPAALRASSSVEKVCVQHPAFKAALDAADRIFQLAKDINIPQGMTVVGPPGTGKSKLIRYFQSTLPNTILEERSMSAISIRLEMRPSVGHVVSLLLRGLKYPFASVSSKTMYVKRDLVIASLIQKGTRIIFVDEAQHMAHMLRYKVKGKDETDVAEFLRELMDEASVGIVLCGTSGLDELRAFDEQLASRVTARFALSDFEAASPNWLGLLSSFAQASELFDLSHFLQAGNAQRFHRATGGNLRRLKRMLTESVLIAHDSDSRMVGDEHLRLAFGRVYGQHTVLDNPYA
jgi:type II secretory pathway predicted ATPase ExeA